MEGSRDEELMKRAKVIVIPEEETQGKGGGEEVLLVVIPDTANSGGKKEAKAMFFHKMETEEISDRFVAPCFVNGLEAYDGEINLGVEENMISNEFAVQLCLDHKVKHGNKVVKKRFNYDLDFGDIPDIDGVDVPQFICKMGKISRNKRKQLEKYQLIYSDIRPLMSTETPLTQEEAEREALAISIYERYSILEEERPRAGLRGSTECKEGDLDVKSLEGRADGAFEQCSVPRRGFMHTCGGIVNTIENITSTFDGICHQTFRAAKTSLGTAKSGSDDEDGYEFQRNKFGAPIYRPKPPRYLNCSNPLDRSLALHEVMNPLRKICVWNKVVSFLGSLPVALQHVEWKPDYTGCFNKKEDNDG
ncbi:hypothetical protein Tco_1290728 [Tanacetum coccineum]